MKKASKAGKRKERGVASLGVGKRHRPERIPYQVALQSRGVGLPDKHRPNRNDDRSQRSVLVGRNDGGDAAAATGANLRKRVKRDTQRRRGMAQQVHSTNKRHMQQTWNESNRTRGQERTRVGETGRG